MKSGDNCVPAVRTVLWAGTPLAIPLIIYVLPNIPPLNQWRELRKAIGVFCYELYGTTVFFFFSKIVFRYKKKGAFKCKTTLNGFRKSTAT